ncbi:hypothetical protein EMCRGX_G012248 [Ephydatia muelleri]
MSDEGPIEESILHAARRLGYHDLREHQLHAAKKFLQGNDVFVSLPTGSGKSLIYAVLPFAFDHLRGSEGSIVVVVSPLLSLMKDQVTALCVRGLRAACITGEASSDQQLQASVMNGEFQLLLIGPELLLLHPLWRAMVRVPVYIEKLVAFAIDEAHCIAQWGDNFRQEFSNLGEIRCLISPSINLLALTATATVTTRKKIQCILGMKDPVIIAVSPDKANMSYWVKERGTVEETFAPLAAMLRNERTKMPRVIIFCRRCEDCASIYDFFLSTLKHEFTEPISAPNVSKFRLVDMYTSVTQKEVQERIVKSFSCATASLRIVVCTIAFGMGIDCAGVNQVIHWRPSADVESYMQECGRAGRNGQASSAVIYVNKSDLSIRTTSKEMKNYCVQQQMCRRSILCSYFDCSTAQVIGCACCDICSKNYQTNMSRCLGAKDLVQESDLRSIVQMYRRSILCSYFDCSTALVIGCACCDELRVH